MVNTPTLFKDDMLPTLDSAVFKPATVAALVTLSTLFLTVAVWQPEQ